MTVNEAWLYYLELAVEQKQIGGKRMKFYECKVEYFDDGAENNTGIWLGYVCAKDYSDAAKKVCDSGEDVILSMSLLETECVDLLDYDACKDFYWKEK